MSSTPLPITYLAYIPEKSERPYFVLLQMKADKIGI
jgi:hypothetical protein